MKSIVIESPGIGNDTKVYCAETGKELHGITDIEISGITVGGVVTAKVTFINVPCKIKAKAEIKVKDTTALKDTEYRRYA